MRARLLHQPVPTSAGAIVMATGILLLGAMKKFEFHHQEIAEASTVVVLLLLFALYMAYGYDFIRGRVWERHLQHPVASFGVGTWIAATSVTVLVVMSFVPSWRPLAIVLFAFDGVLLAGYLVLIIRNYIHLFRMKEFQLREKVNGILLLACVAVQSVAAAGYALYEEPFAVWIAVWLWRMGILFYLLGFVLIMNRYIHIGKLNLPRNWENTNCVIHGAMSISGLVGATTNVISPVVLCGVWVWVFVTFLLVEGVEIVRFVQRIRRYGWKEGIWIYHTSQWARNFTFGMLLAFSMHLHVQTKMLTIFDFKYWVVTAGPYAVTILFVLELFIAVTGRPAESKSTATVSL